MVKTGVLVSGNGTNLQAILDANTPALDIAVVISNRPDVHALNRAEWAGVPALTVDHKNFGDRKAFEEELVGILDQHQVELVVLAGFMRILTPFFVNRYKNRILNTHPSLLPAFPGKDAVRQALDYGVKLTGCTIHLVDEGVDTGPVLMQECVPVEDYDTETSLTRKIQAVEHTIYPKAINDFASRGMII